MDRIDRNIVMLLQERARIPNTELADAVNLSPSPCLRRVRDLERRGVVTGYRATVDQEKVGLGLTVFVEVSAANHHRETMSSQLQDAFLAMPEVVACHMVSGMADFLLQVLVPDLRHYERFLLDRLLPLDGVRDARSHVSIRTVKENAPLPLGHLT